MAANGQQSRAGGVLSYGQRQLDRIISPESRQKTSDAVAAFAVDKPFLFAFVVSQLLFSSLPLVLFASFALSSAIFALISAVVFSLFWIGIAMLLLVPTLFVTFSIAVLVWLWAAATFTTGRWVYNMIPGSVRGDMHVKMPNGKQVIFQKERQGHTESNGFDDVDVKSEVTETKE